MAAVPSTIRTHCECAPRGTDRQPLLPAARRQGQEFQPDEVAPQHPLQPVSGQGIEESRFAEQLHRVFPDPAPRSHFQRQWKKNFVRIPVLRLKVKVVPQVAMRHVLPALRLEDVVVVRIAAAEQFVQRG